MDKARACFWAAGGGLAIFVADIVAAKAQIAAGESIPVHLGDTLQFLLLLVIIVLFVAGALIREREEIGDAGQGP